jgi:hypothetical protein
MLSKIFTPLFLILVILVVIGLYTVSGWACFSDDEVATYIRDTFSLESGCHYINRY